MNLSVNNIVEKLQTPPEPILQEVLDFVEQLQQKTTSEITSPSRIPSLQQIATLPLDQRHQWLTPFVTAMAEDFQNDPELMEFAGLDDENWEWEDESSTR
jgi:hypothetical protein